MESTVPSFRDLQPGTKTTRLVPVKTTAGDETSIPIILIRGGQPGPTLCITAGVHGAEYNGIQTAMRIANDTDPASLRGSLIVIPIVNVPAFEARSIYIGPNDGKNLNRVFPGSPDGTMSEVIAHAALGIVTSQADYHVDLHAGDMVEAIDSMVFLQRCGVPERDRAAEELASIYGMANIVETETTVGWSGKGTFSATAQEAGVVSIAAEIGGRGILEDRCVQVQLRGLGNVMRHLEMIDGLPEPVQPPAHIPGLVYLTAPVKGMFYPHVACGDFVKEGQPVATITDYLGEVLHVARAPLDGKVLVVISSLAVAQNGLTLGFGAV